MTDSALVLICPFTNDTYESQHKTNINCWLEFFVHEKKIPVIATVPLSHFPENSDLQCDRVSEYLQFCPVICFDTCDAWHVGFYDAIQAYNPARYVYLWSADFECNQIAKDAADRLLTYPEENDLLVGTIEASGTKEDIDQWSTYPLLKYWFPVEYKKLKQMGFSKPRSELLRLSVDLLTYALKKRWFPAEQTIHLIFQCLWNGKFNLAPTYFPKIKDDDVSRDHPNFIQQVERMEVWIKQMWRERQNELVKEWEVKEVYKENCEDSFKILMKVYDNLIEKTPVHQNREREIEICLTQMPASL